ncbi:ribosome biogenesis GTPase Der [Myxococcota bacterium]|nr:ribosome biogenesis GTPase Der [Myxococcota bacterium]MBU1897559.1 ribosome biogenesis GTPase Der [Myxococcota bacterium]
MSALVAVVGRPNVGKSTLFNRLIGEKKAIVLDTPGVTRDRQYGVGRWDRREFDVVDTGGFEPEAEEGVVASMRRQAMLAVEAADVVIFVVDAREGLVLADQEVAQILRRASERVFLAVNKIDGARQEGDTAEFYSLGFTEVFSVSAEHGRGVGELLDEVIRALPPEEDDEGEEDERITRVALVGRPNVGKSTLTNRLLGEERMIVDAVAGTTRDAIDARLRYEDKDYLLIDTAGLRRSRGIDRQSSEGYSVVRTLRAMERCHVAVLLIDATIGITDQDARIAGLANEKGRALVLVVNKWDAIEKDHKTAKVFTEEIQRKLMFVDYAPILFISSLTGLRVHKLMGLVDQVRAGHLFRASTGVLNRWLEKTVEHHHPPMVKGRRLRLTYATQARTAPPTLVISCNLPEEVHFSYKRYLINQFRESFDVVGTPIRIKFHGKKNPFVTEEGEGKAKG